MKKWIAIFLLLWLVACRPAAQPAETADPPLAADDSEEETVATETAVPANETVAPITPATDLAEASQVRPQDQVIGAANPKVVIIEYGDFQ